MFLNKKKVVKLMLYKDLNLNYLKDLLNLDFAHFSYVNEMCSCCYSISDFPSNYWRNGIIVSKDSLSFEEVNYILFKNSIGGKGEVKENDTLDEFESIEYQFCNRELLINFCKELSKICSKFDYEVLIPPNEDLSIILLEKILIVIII